MVLPPRKADAVGSACYSDFEAASIGLTELFLVRQAYAINRKADRYTPFIPVRDYVIIWYQPYDGGFQSGWDQTHSPIM
jgi:hypothetical protein